jgi:predicted secreted protein
LVYADDVDILGESVHTIKENAEVLELASKETRLEVNADETKYTVMSRDQTTGSSHNLKTDNTLIRG